MRRCSLRLADGASGDDQHRMDKRDLDVAVPVGPRLTSGNAARSRSASAKCSPAAALGGWVFMGRTSFPVKGSGPVSDTGRGPPSGERKARHHLRVLSNLTLLCGHHHHRSFTKLGWTCRMQSGTPHWTLPRWIDPPKHPAATTRITHPTSSPHDSDIEATGPSPTRRNRGPTGHRCGPASFVALARHSRARSRLDGFPAHIASGWAVCTYAASARLYSSVVRSRSVIGWWTSGTVAVERVGGR
jgi:hypothetical protein